MAGIRAKIETINVEDLSEREKRNSFSSFIYSFDGMSIRFTQVKITKRISCKHTSALLSLKRKFTFRRIQAR